jgi:uncharacterized protein
MRTSLGVLLVVAVLLGLVTSVHAYFIERLVLDPQLPQPWAALATAAIVLGAVLFFLQPIAERLFAPAVGRLLAWPAYLWLGACFYLLLGLGLSDLLHAVLESSVGFHPGAFARTRAAAVLSAVCVILSFGCWNALRGPIVERVVLTLPNWPAALDGYRVVQISDVHIGSLLGRGFARRVTQRCNALAADLIAVTGDLVDGSVSHLEQRVAPFAELRARDGVYFVTGNHDHYSGADGWTHKLAEFGFEVLRNRRVHIAASGAAFELAGVDDYSSRRHGRTHQADLELALRGWERNTPLVLLAHDPRSFDPARSCGVDLQLSGHTHAGQIWPFHWLVRLQTRYVAGLYRNEGSTLYVSRGTGFWGPPLRLFAPSEITELVLYRMSAEDALPQS